jgi:ABC-type transport system substrate-binding protein
MGNGSARSQNGALTGVRLRLAATYRQRPEGTDGYALREIALHCEPSFNDAIAAFQRGEVNSISELSPDALRVVSALPQLTLYTAYRPAFGAVIYNWQRGEVGFFRDFRMRQALARSVDRVTLVNRFMAGRAVSADSPILPNSWAYEADVTCPGYDPGNPDAAKPLARCKSAAGYEPGRDSGGDCRRPGRSAFRPAGLPFSVARQ